MEDLAVFYFYFFTHRRDEFLPYERDEALQRGEAGKKEDCFASSRDNESKCKLSVDKFAVNCEWKLFPSYLKMKTNKQANKPSKLLPNVDGELAGLFSSQSEPKRKALSC